MTDVTEPFEQHRNHLRAVAFRMLGSVSEADDAVQEAWLRLHRSDTSDVHNLGGWLTTVVARVCLDMLRSRTARREEPMTAQVPEPTNDPQQEAQLAETVGLAVLVVLDTLEPAERLAFVLHDMFAVPFDDIARIVGRSPAATRQLASRARRRVQGVRDVPAEELRRQRGLVDAFLSALRAGDVEGIVAVLDPDVVVRTGATEMRGARTWAKGAAQFGAMAKHVQPMLVDGQVGLVLAPRGHVTRALRFTFAGDTIAEVEIIMDRERVQALDIAVLA